VGAAIEVVIGCAVALRKLENTLVLDVSRDASLDSRQLIFLLYPDWANATPGAPVDGEIWRRGSFWVPSA
jgi:hypothetical protein